MRHASLSRRTWLWTSTTALAAACARPAPTKLPEGGPEPSRALTRLGAENLRTLAELGATLRWFHPSDQALAVEWEPLLLDGIRGIEAAESQTELVEGLRGLFAELAPTMVIWRAEPDAMVGIAPDELACPAPEPAAAEPVEPPSDPTATPEPAATPPDRARSPDKVITRAADGLDGPPARTTPGAPSTRTQEQLSDPEPEPTPEPKPESSPAPEPEPTSKPSERASKSEGDADEPEQQPPLHEALFAEGDTLEICQWHRQSFCEGLEGQLGCARRIYRTDAAATAPVHGRKHARSDCDGEPPLLTPGAPARLSLPRGLGGLIPLALWARDGRTLPLADSPTIAPAFDEARAWDYDLADRGTRLLALVRCYSLLRCFYAHHERVADAHEHLRAGLCAAAEAESPADLQAALEHLLAAFTDGNAELRVEFGKLARRWVPPISLAWVEERVVVSASSLADVLPGDEVTAIDGVAIDELLARELPRTSASTPSVAIARTVDRLLARRERSASLEIGLLRDGDSQQFARASASEPVDARAPDLRPRRPLTELRRHVWYVDPTRATLQSVARLRRARVVIIDLRGRLANANHSLLGHWLDEPLEVGRTRNMSGPDQTGELSLGDAAAITITPRRPRLHARVMLLCDHRTSGAAELELLGFDMVRDGVRDMTGITIIGSNSAGQLGAVSRAWLPGGWQLHFTTGELMTHDGRSPWAHGIAPTVHTTPTRAGLAAGTDELLQVALSLTDP